MSNPYEAPMSDLGAEKQPVSKTKWKVFFWIMFSLEALSLISMFNDPEETLLYLVLEIIVYSTILIGLFGFAYNKRIIKDKFWAYIIPIGIVFDAYSLFDLDWTFESPEEMYFVVAFTIIMLVPLMSFQYLALFKYSFRSPEIWE